MSAHFGSIVFAAVIVRLRALFRKGEGERAPLDLNDAVVETANLVSPDAVRRGVALKLALDPALSTVMGDRVQLQQVLLNLLLNGLDAAGSDHPHGVGIAADEHPNITKRPARVTYRRAMDSQRPPRGPRMCEPRGVRWRCRCASLPS